MEDPTSVCLCGEAELDSISLIGIDHNLWMILSIFSFLVFFFVRLFIMFWTIHSVLRLWGGIGVIVVVVFSSCSVLESFLLKGGIALKRPLERWMSGVFSISISESSWLPINRLPRGPLGHCRRLMLYKMIFQTYVPFCNGYLYILERWINYQMKFWNLFVEYTKSS